MKSDYDRSKTVFCKTTENYHPLDPLLLICRHINSGIHKDEYVNTCILGRTYFVERSIHLIEEH